MPTLTIRDADGHEIATEDLQGSGLGKYFRLAATFRSAAAIAQGFTRPLTDQDAARSLSLALDTDVPVGAAGELSLSAGASAGLALHEGGSTLFAGSDLQAAVPVPNGTTYVSLTLEAVLKAGLAGAAGALGFGFKGGTGLRYAYFHPFDTVAATPSVGDGVRAMLRAAILPADADDLKRMPPGAFASLAGEGEISLTGTVALSSSANLLATPGLPLVGSLALTQGASVAVAAAWTASGEFELRVSKPAASLVRVAFHRRRGRSLSVSATATAGVGATLGGKDLLATLMTAISANPEADLLALVDAGLGDAAIKAIQDAVSASIDRTLTVAAQFQVSALSESEALFAYEIDLGQLRSGDEPILKEALHGRLRALETLAAQPNSAVRLVSSAMRSLHEKKTTWRLNLLGILNVATFVDLVREGTVLFDPVTGALTAADKVTATRIRSTSRPLESNAEKLRQVLFESLMVTAAYQASRALGASLSLTAEQAYVEQHGKTRRHDLEEHYRVLLALGLCDAAERDRRLGAETNFGNSTFSIQNRFDAAACDGMFLTPAGKPRSRADYESLARQSFLALLPPDDPVRAFRRVPLASDELWARVRELGGAIDAALPDHIRHDGRKLALVRGDVFTIAWWSGAMAKAATALSAMRTFLAQRDAATLHDSPEFQKARESLSKALGAVAATTQAVFDDPWDILAMDAAAARKGSLEAAIISPRFAARYGDDMAAVAAVSAAATMPRAARVPLAVGRASAPRDWTDAERETFNRHVVNLHGGMLSSAGSFSSSIEQVQRIFREHIPAYARQQRALGAPARVLFFAHGGLIEEREGLLPVLARRRCWDLNGIYPVYFVWETGLFETLRDILASAVPARARLGALSDALIEQLAREGGKVVWGRMKTSAEKAADAGGGSALVAELAGELWAASGGEIEFHALGHSAGAILHGFFLPLLAGRRPAGVPPLEVRSVHLLAPAITSDLFKARIKDLVGSGKPIARLTTYTMTDEHERADASLKPYSKSLLYLVSQAFEEAPGQPILGLQKSLKTDLQLIRFFGLAGTEKVADITFSQTADGTPLNARTQSITHGGFDNDIETMTSVLRRVLDVSGDQPIVDYFEEAVTGFDRAAVGGAPSA